LQYTGGSAFLFTFLALTSVKFCRLDLYLTVPLKRGTLKN